MSPTLIPLNSRNLSSGLAQRTLRNLEFIKGGSATVVHAVTQVVNSLLALLVFPVEKEERFFGKFSGDVFPTVQCSHGSKHPDLVAIQDKLRKQFGLSSLAVVKFDNCANVSRFFRRLRNAIVHKHLRFGGSDPDSKLLADVKVTLGDKPRTASDFDWEIAMTAEDLEKLSRFVAQEVITLGL